MRKVIVVNGKPRAGKDTAIAFMQEILAEHGIQSMQFSSIDPVRNVIQALGIDVSAKTPADRALLAEIGAAVEKHSGYRSKACLTEALRFLCCYHNAVVFLHIREPAMIETVAAVGHETSVESLLREEAHFRPGRPVPTHRMAAT